MEKSVKQAFCLAIAVKFGTQGFKENHNILWVASFYQNLRVRAKLDIAQLPQNIA
jgi:hypothetical protein